MFTELLAPRAVIEAENPQRNVPAWLDLPEPKGFRPKRKYRTVWISDVHLGTRGCKGLAYEAATRAVRAA